LKTLLKLLPGQVVILFVYDLIKAR